MQGYERLEKLFKEYKKKVLEKRKRFTLIDFEEYLIDRSGGVTGYEKAGGYQALCQLLCDYEDKGKIVSIKSSEFNGRIPPLKVRWQFVETVKQGWDDTLIFKLSRRLDLNYFLKRPALQSERLSEKLKNIARFLAEKEEREWASREERSFELFGNEKYLLDSAGKKLLTRLHLTLGDIKAEKYSQMFVYWNQGTSKIKNILILENHSAFIACKRAIEGGYEIFSYAPDTLIFGGGNHIIDSLKFLNEIADLQLIQIKYAGDIDPAGLAIYTGLCEKYPELAISLHTDYYKQMLLRGNSGYPIVKEQKPDESVLEKVVEEFLAVNEEPAAEKIKELYRNELRIPQEIVTFEVLTGRR